jgi:hypothetical protein
MSLEKTRKPALVFRQEGRYSFAVKTFGEILDSTDELSLDEQESLVTVLRHRVAEQRRADLIKSVKEARQQFKEGRCRPARSSEIVRRNLS